MIHLEQVPRLMSLVNVTTMLEGWCRNQPITCTASSPPLSKIGGHEDSAAALHPTLLQMPLPLLRNLEGASQISPKALFRTINMGSYYWMSFTLLASGFILTYHTRVWHLMSFQGLSCPCLVSTILHNFGEPEKYICICRDSLSKPIERLLLHMHYVRDYIYSPAVSCPHWELVK